MPKFFRSPPFWLSLLTLAFVGLQWPYVIDLRPYDYDEGVYWQTVWSLHEGHRLYSEIFYSQLPLFAHIARFFYALGGESLAALRGGVVLFSALAIPAAYFLGRHLRSTALGLILATSLAVNSRFFSFAHQFKGEAPALALVLLSFWSLTEKSKWRLVLGAVLAALAVQMKISMLPAAVFLGLWAWGLQNTRSAWSRALVFALTFAAVQVLVSMVTGWWPDGLEQLQSGSWRGSVPVIGLQGFEKITTFFLNAGEREPSNLLLPVLSLVIGGLFARRHPKIARWAWLFFGLFALAIAVHRVIWPQHYLAFSLFFVAMTSLWLANSRESRGWRRGLTFLCALSLGWDLIADLDPIWRQSQYRARDRAEQASAVQALSITPPESFVLTDDPFTAAVAARRVPPEFVDTSAVTLELEKIRCDDLVRKAEDPRVSALMVTKKFRYLDCGEDEFVARVRPQFPREVVVAPERRFYFRASTP